MIKNLKYVALLSVAVCSMAWLACKQQRAICLTPTVASLNIVFLHLPTDTSAVVFTDTALPAAIFVALTAKARPDTTFQQQSTFTISLSPDSTYCQWLFKPDTNSLIFDTLSFYYQRNLQFLSNACGFTYFYTLDSVHTTHYSIQLNPYIPTFSIDSAQIVNASVTNNVNTTQLQVYIRRD